MGSDKASGAGNQQERLPDDERRFWFLAGFVEGEGSVHLAIKTHPTKRYGCYVQPEFFIYQHQSRRDLLEMAQEHLGAGRIRPKQGNPDVLVFSIISRKQIAECVVPFLKRCLALSSRRDDYQRFIAAVELLEEGRHRTLDGLIEVVTIGYSMNMGGKQRRIPLDEVIRRILRGHMPDDARAA